MQIHGPSAEFAAADVTVELNATRPQDPFITIMWPNGVRVYLDEGEADYLIKLILQAKDMLHAHRHAVACHAGLGEYVNGTAEVAEPKKDLRVKLCRCDRDPRSHVPWPGCPEWKDYEGLPVANRLIQVGDIMRASYGSLHGPKATKEVTVAWVSDNGHRIRTTEGESYQVPDLVATGCSVPLSDAEVAKGLPVLDDDEIARQIARKDAGLKYDAWWLARAEHEATGLPVAEDDGGDGDDSREPYCTTCLFTVTAAGEHMYPDGVLMPAHETEIGWREPVGRPTGEDAQAAEVRRIGKLHTDGHITEAECAEMTDKVLGERA